MFLKLVLYELFCSFLMWVSSIGGIFVVGLDRKVLILFCRFEVSFLMNRCLSLVLLCWWISLVV